MQFGNLTSKVVAKRNELADIQLSLLKSPQCIDLIEKEKIISQEVCSLVQVEESYFKQKSRIS